MEEIWKDVVGFENDYKVSNLGRIKSTKKGKEHILKGCNIINGRYRSVVFSLGNIRKRESNHVVVAKAFLGVPSNPKMVVDHIDNNGQNNNVENLQWLTQRENLIKNHPRPSEYLGVHYSKRWKKYVATIQIKDKKIILASGNDQQYLSNLYKKASELIHLYNGDSLEFRNMLIKMLNLDV